jgi:hypothetical protein
MSTLIHNYSAGWANTGVRGMATVAAAAVATTSTAVNTAAEPAVLVAGERSAASPSSNMELAIAPKMATLIALPIERAKRVALVTTPRTSQSTLDWTAIQVGTSPRPKGSFRR